MVTSLPLGLTQFELEENLRWGECRAARGCVRTCEPGHTRRKHFERVLSAAPPVQREVDRIRVADVNFGVNNARYGVV